MFTRRHTLAKIKDLILGFNLKSHFYKKHRSWKIEPEVQALNYSSASFLVEQEIWKIKKILRLIKIM